MRKFLAIFLTMWMLTLQVASAQQQQYHCPVIYEPLMAPMLFDKELLAPGEAFPGWGFRANSAGGSPTDAQYIVLALDGTLTDERKITAGTLINFSDGGANGNLTISVTSPIPIANGGTNGTTAQTGINNIAGLTTKGDLLANNGTNDVRLGVGTDTFVLRANSATATGLEYFDISTLGPSAASYVTASAEAGLSAERVLTGTANKITVTDNGGVTGTIVLNVGTDIVQLTSSQTLTNKTLGSTLVLNNALRTAGITLNSAGANNGTLTWANFGSSNTFTIPDVSSSDFVMTESNQTINGTKTFSDLKLSGTTFKTAANTITVPAATDTLVNLGSTQTLAAKTLTAPVIGTSLTLGTDASPLFFTFDNPASTRTINFADPLGNDTVAYLAASQTLTNKHIDTSEIDSGSAFALTIGGTGSTTAQGATNNLLNGSAGGAAAEGDIMVRGPTNWTRLPIGANGKVLTINTGVSGKLEYQTPASTGAPTTAQYIVGTTDATLTAEQVLTGTSNRITVTLAGGDGGNATLDIGTDVVTLTGTQILTNKTLTAPQITTGSTITFKETTKNAIIQAADQATADRTYTIPDSGANASFLMTQGAQTKAGVLTLSSAPVLSTNTLSGNGNTMTFPASAQTLVGLTDSVTLTNKTLTAPVISSGSTITFTEATKNAIVQAADQATADRTYTIPDSGANASFLMTQGAQTKAGVLTLSSAPVLSTNTLSGNGNAMTFPSSAQTLVGLTSTDTLTNKTLTAPVISTGSTLTFTESTHNAIIAAADQATTDRTYTIPDSGANASFLMTQGAQTKAGALTLSSAPVLSTNTLSGNGNTMTFPSSAQTLVGLTSTDTLTNKTLTTPSITSGGTITFIEATKNAIITAADQATADRTYTVIDAGGNDSFVMAAATQTLTNKSIAASEVNSGTLPIARGGTNNGSLVVTQGVVYFGDGSKIVGLATGTAGQVLSTNGAGADPSWITLAGGGNVTTTGSNTYSALSIVNDFSLTSKFIIPLLGSDLTSTPGAIWVNLGLTKIWDNTAVTPVKHTLVYLDTNQTFADIITFTSKPVLSTNTISGNGNTMTFPSSAQTLVGLTSTDTLTNKTLTAVQISSGSTITFVEATKNAIITAADQATADRTYTIPDSGANASFLMTQGAQTKAGVLTLSSAPVLSTNTLSGNGNTMTFPSSAQTLVGLTSTDTLTNKTLTAASITAASTLTFLGASRNAIIQASEPATSTRTYTIPDAGGNDSFVFLAATQTLTNKSIAASEVNSGTLAVAQGGTNIASYTAGDLIRATGSTTLTKLGLGTALQELRVNAGGTDVEWATISAGSGTVTSVAQSLTGLGFISLSGSPITTSGTLALTASVATGDTLYGSASNVISKLALGTDTQVYTQASSIPSWAFTQGGTPTAKNSTVSLVSTDSSFITSDTSGGAVVLTLPACSTTAGKVYWIEKVAGTNALTVSRAGSDTIDGATSKVFTSSSTVNQKQILGIVSDGSATWRVIQDNILPATAGGTGVAQWTTGDLVRASGTNVISALAHPGTANLVLRSSSSTALGYIGGLMLGQTSYSADHTIAAGESYFMAVSASGAARTITLPDPTLITGSFMIGITKSDSSTNTVTVSRAGSNTIRGAGQLGVTSFTLTKQYETVILIGEQNDAVWYVISHTNADNPRLNRSFGGERMDASPTTTGTITGELWVDGDWTTTGAITCNRCRIHVSGNASIQNAISVSNGTTGTAEIINATAATTGSISANGGGIGGGSGGGANAMGGGGGGNGGIGGNGGSTSAGRIAFGGASYSLENYLGGSNGGNGNDGSGTVEQGGCGAGGFYLEVGGNLTINSTVTADGQTGVGANAAFCGGGGAGGTVDVRVNGNITVSANKTWTANGGTGGGGNSSSAGGGGGGGGNINVQCNGTLTETGTLTLTCSGGAIGTASASQAPTAGAAGVTNKEGTAKMSFRSPN